MTQLQSWEYGTIRSYESLLVEWFHYQLLIRGIWRSVIMVCVMIHGHSMRILASLNELKSLTTNVQTCLYKGTPFFLTRHFDDFRGLSPLNQGLNTQTPQKETVCLNNNWKTKACMFVRLQLSSLQLFEGKKNLTNVFYWSSFRSWQPEFQHWSP